VVQGKMVLGYFGRTPTKPDAEVVKIASKQDNPRKFLAVYFGLAIIVLFLGLVSIAPQVGNRLGEIAVEKEKQATLAVNVDTDKDGFNDSQELAMGTDIKSSCPVNPSHDAWPPDVNNDKVVNDLDANLIAEQAGAGTYNSRYDLNMDSIINTDDIILLIEPVNYYSQTCSN